MNIFSNKNVIVTVVKHLLIEVKINNGVQDGPSSSIPWTFERILIFPLPYRSLPLFYCINF